MTRARRVRLLAESSEGSADGCDGLMTRARRRRLLAERSGTNSEDLAAGPHEWRDWANLTCDLVEDIAVRLLSHDVAEYYSFRAVCRPWRYHTTDLLRARAPLDSRFRPRNWVLLTITPNAATGSCSCRRRVLNMATAACLSVNLPALSTHCHLGAVDGLLILFNRITRTIRLLDPLSNAVTEFPAISSIVLNARPSIVHHFSMFLKNPDGHSVNGACLDESTSLPTLVLCLRDNQCCIIVAKPGDPHWMLVDQGKLYHSETLGRVMFHSLLSQGGRCFVTTREGSIFLLKLGLVPPPPRLVEIISQRQHATRDAIQLKRVLSFLVAGCGCRNGVASMLLLRYWRNIEHFGGRRAYNEMQHQHLFTVGGVTGCIEVLEVDIAGRMLIPVRSLGPHCAAFVGMTHSMLVSTKTFPSIVADSIYLGCSYQFSQKFSIYTRRTEPQHEFRRDENQRLVTCVRPCNLDQYLVCYVDRKHMLSGPCINHVGHYCFVPSIRHPISY